MRIVLLSLYNFHSFAIRGFHALLQSKCDVSSIFFKNSTYTDNAPTESEINELAGSIKLKHPDFLAVSVHSPVFPIFKEISKRLRGYCKIIIGGEHATALPEECLKYADYVVVGEGENALLDLAVGKLQEGITRTEPFRNLDDIPFPYYGNEIIPIMKSFSYLSGRGCPFRCSYCTESVRCEPLRRKSVDKVIEDVKQVSSMFGVNRIVFSDSVFTLDKNWLSDFCDKFPSGMDFMCYGHSMGIDRETISMLKDAGISTLRMGVQSGSVPIRKLYNRKESLDEILSAAWLLYENKIPVGYDFIINSPYEDYGDLQYTRDFIKKLPPYSGINCFELRWFPKTPLTEKALQETKIYPEDIEGQYNRFGHWDYTYMRGT